eukprot:TRINITY_DN4004_c0_g1_i1.p1 TRINITY_DN4004_c0_g1~~TRINITY_DN4004_c0_g1_i1.p1  ORF type:complete len:194 (+),score=17.47 TRINITY_DN4004_c0_g1_i1:46-627(+)
MGNLECNEDFTEGQMSSFPSHELDKSRVGNVFLVQRKQALNLTDPSQRCLAHFSVVIDVAGESTNTHLIGQECHLVINKPISNTEVTAYFNRISKRYDQLLDHRYLGKIENKYHSGHPDDWANGLRFAIYNWFCGFRGANGSTWSLKSNCQQFARFLILKLKLPWPNDINVIGDRLPVVVDIGMLAVSSIDRS